MFLRPFRIPGASGIFENLFGRHTPEDAPTNPGYAALFDPARQ
jgi:hypothetical protein